MSRFDAGSSCRARVLAHLSDGRVSAVVTSDDGMPELAYWGAGLGDDDIAPALFERAVMGGGLDVDAPLGFVAEAARGWFGRPGLEGSRTGGRDFAPRFELAAVDVAATRLVVGLDDPHARLHLDVELELRTGGVLAIGATLRNDGDDDYTVGALRLSLPVGGHAAELLTLGGRHLFEFASERVPWTRTCTTVENRRGKTSHERLGVVVVGTVGFGEHTGEVWGCHLGWSGNYELVADAVTDGRRVVQLGELIGPSEVVLAPGQAYHSPTAYGAYSASGLTAMSRSFHAYLRSRPSAPRRPRPVHLNTWEAVYFDHDQPTLIALADVAARIGIERFVLDDGWFGARRDDTRGLGDWTVSDEAWPDGLSPIIDHVRALGMEFGIWVEPEMINPDSDLYRQHPEWTLADQRYPGVLGRHQLVLDVGRGAVRDHLFQRLDSLLRDHDIAYVKWDHNRDLVAPTGAHGAHGVHDQTLGFYELLDRVRAAHPGVEFETCASGGGRVDFGVLERTERVWTSDSIDALDRHAIQRGFSLLFPPELMGSHIGAPVAHTTGRTHRLAFRASAALFGAFGVEWNLLRATPEDLDQLAEIVAVHRRLRPLLHDGDVLRTDHPDPTVEVHGVIARDRTEAVIEIARLASGPDHHGAPVRIPGLDDAIHYEVAIVDVGGTSLRGARRQPGWVHGTLVATGRQLGAVGFHAPQLRPERSVLVHLHAVDR